MKERKEERKEKWYERGSEGELEIHLFFLSHSLGILICQHPGRMVTFIYSTIYSTKDKETNKQITKQIFTQPKQTKR